ncbi:ATP/GTP-binding protein [Streptomyces sp. NPDC059816]|uniref:GTP-binding protein n=1 Tax=Streptomyces sp. NPDC059816 TaxID=3346960 RepID=UPI0036526AD1
MTAARLVIGGPYGVGKTTFVGAASEIDPLRTDATVTDASTTTDRLLDPHKTTTTTLMDFGRLTFPDQRTMLLLYGVPGQDRFRFLWDHLMGPAIGAIVLVDTRDLNASFGSLDFFESSGRPFLVAVNHFAGSDRYTTGEIRHALQLPDHVPLLECDARSRASARDVLIAFVHHALTTQPATLAPSPGRPF